MCIPNGTLVKLDSPRGKEWVYPHVGLPIRIDNGARGVKIGDRAGLRYMVEYGEIIVTLPREWVKPVEEVES